MPEQGLVSWYLSDGRLQNVARTDSTTPSDDGGHITTVLFRDSLATDGVLR